MEYAIAGLSLIAAVLYIAGRVRGLSIKNITNILPTDGQYRKRSLSEITDITVHHTAGPDSQTAESIANYHVYSKGWPGIGYHYLINTDGQILQVNELDTVSYHNGYNNTAAVGIAMIGNMELGPPTPPQQKSLEKLIQSLKKDLPRLSHLLGHKELPGAATACPGFYTDMDDIREIAGLVNPYNLPQSFAVRASYGPASGGYNPDRADN